MARLVAGVNAAMTALAASVALVSLAALAGDRAPRLDVLAHLALVYAALSLVTLAWAIARRRKAPGVLSLVALTASGALMAPEFRREAGPVAAPNAPRQIKVIHLNMQRSNGDVRRAADWLIAQQPDFVMVSESRSDLRDMLQARSGWKVSGGRGDQMIFTPERRSVMNRPRGGPKAVTFVNATHASASGPIEAVTTHVEWPTHPRQPAQLADVEYVVRQLPRDRMILAGDFNLTPWSAALRRLDGRLGLIRRDRAVSTWPAEVLGRPWPLPFLPIDHVYAGPGWATVKVERGPWLGSDHYPLVVTLAPVSRR